MTPTTIEPEQHIFECDGTFPNSLLPLLLYRQAVETSQPGAASAIELLLASHGWAGAWRNGVYPFPHYHSTAHEVLAIYRGRATIELGGPEIGTAVAVRAGDVIVIPAGVSHQRLDSSDDFAVLGAYPDGQDVDLFRGDPGHLQETRRNVAGVPLPATDPLYGADGPLPRCWAT